MFCSSNAFASLCCSPKNNDKNEKRHHRRTKQRALQREQTVCKSLPDSRIGNKKISFREKEEHIRFEEEQQRQKKLLEEKDLERKTLLQEKEPRFPDFYERDLSGSYESSDDDDLTDDNYMARLLRFLDRHPHLVTKDAAERYNIIGR
jgi:hypothetical protein